MSQDIADLLDPLDPTKIADAIARLESRAEFYKGILARLQSFNHCGPSGNGVRVPGKPIEPTESDPESFGDAVDRAVGKRPRRMPKVPTVRGERGPRSKMLDQVAKTCKTSFKTVSQIATQLGKTENSVRQVIYTQYPDKFQRNKVGKSALFKFKG